MRALTLLPVVERELRVAARRPSTYWVRTFAGVLVLAVASWCFLVFERQTPREVASIIFGVLTGSAGLFCLFSGVQTTADCLSREKREGTLGLLFLTDLKGSDVVFGKLTANSINSFYSALAVVPLLAVPLLMGGVTPGEFWRMALVVVNTLFFSLSIGMGVSAVCRDARRAMGSAFLCIIVLTALGPAIGGVLSVNGWVPQWLSMACFLLSPGFSYAMAFDQPFTAKPGLFVSSLVAIHLLGWGFLALASRVTPHTWQDRPGTATTLTWREWWRGWNYGDTHQRAELRRQLLDANAFLWLAARVRWKPVMVWVVLGLLALSWLWGLAKFRQEWLNEGIYITTGVILNILLKGWFASECGRQLADDRQQGALELLISTPLTEREIARGQWLALQRQFLAPTAVVLIVQVMFMVLPRGDMVPASERTLWVWLWGGSMVMLVADLAALFWVGLWQAMTAKHPSRAPTNSVWLVLVLPWIAFALVMVFVVLASTQARRAPEPTWRFFVGWWLFLGLGTDVVVGVAARYQFLTRFREFAARRYQPAATFWGRLRGG